ncbi:ParA family protein [Spirosoma sp. KNUC1025]|uniref:ParA family protein n=1 Tax=Spirosoma sp. KNUC1025 TaxID=2894082 RepID=UPI001E28418C|nr:ParA family protein [Spirosoma sp. KNUC1025]UFH57917.1 ParA family protein [Spirosoma sp. KNUC1025]
MKILTIAHQKGGVGKTTLALNLAYCFADSARVAVTDTDLQGSINNLGRLVMGIDLVSPETVLEGKLSGYDLLVIDTPPYLTSRLPDLFAISDYVLVPTKTAVLDLMAIRATIALLRESMKRRPNLKAGIVLNMVMPRTSLTAEVKEALQEYDLPVLPTMIHQRVSYARSPLTAGVFESDDEKAKDEIQNLATDILNQLQ